VEIKEGMIGLSGGNSFIQNAIKYFTKSQFSHSFVVMDGPYRSLSILETTSTIVSLTPFSTKISEPNYIEMWEVISTIEIKDILKNNYLTYAAQWYGYLSYLWFMWRWFWRLLGIEKNVMWKWAVTGQTCTELTCNGYLCILFPEIFVGKDINTIAPEELRVIMLANPDKFKCLGWFKTP